MSKVLVISGHPDLASSHTNSVILDELSFQLADVEVRYLDELYPDYQIDVAAEQKAFIEAGAALDLTNYEADTPKQTAQRYGYTDIVELLDNAK